MAGAESMKTMKGGDQTFCDTPKEVLILQSRQWRIIK